MNDINYAEELIKFRDKNPDATFKDFFKFVGIKKKHRSNFLIACILRQVRELEKE